MNFDILKRTIFLALSGSRAYGFSNPDSDYDYRGIVIPPLDTYVGIKDKFEQAVSKELWKQFTKPISSQDLVSEGADMQVYELSKFVRLAAQCNPSIIEILFTDPSFYVEPPHPVMDRLLDNKDLFLSKQAKARFCGYALSQLNRIKRHKKWIDDPPTAPPVRADFGLADKKLISLDQLGAAEAIIDHELSKFMVEQTDLPEHTKIELSAEMGRTLKFAWQALHQDKPFPVGGDQIFDSVEEAQRLAIARYEGFSENFLVILDAEKRYRAAKQHWDSYVHWLQERNPVRAELEKKFGYDCHVEETEFLTKDGWKIFDDITELDELATIYTDASIKNNRVNKLDKNFTIQYQKYTEKYSGLFTGHLYNLIGYHTDVLVTPNHRMLIRKVERNNINKKYNWCLQEISNLPDTFEIVRQITPHKKNYQDKHFFEGINIPDVTYMRLMGWYLSEGSVGKYTKKTGEINPKYISLSQKKNGRLHNSFVKFSKKYKDISTFNIYKHKPDKHHPDGIEEDILRIKDKFITTKLYNECGDVKNKRIPRWVFNLSKYKMKTLFDAMMMGDGTFNRPDNFLIYYTSVKNLANDVNELALLCGFETSLYGPYENNMYQIHINKTREQTRKFTRGTSINKTHVENKRIVCFTVPNSTLITRYNGHIGLHGNSKHATHLVRLIRMAREILETGQVQVFRADAEELRSIRAGAWTYEKIIEFAEQEDIALIEVAKNSKLPKSPDINKIHEITFNMIMDFNANY
jgi:predicted nucleotidyltransferase